MTEDGGSAAILAEPMPTVAVVCGSRSDLPTLKGCFDVLDSYGMLAVAMDQRSAAEELGLVAGDQVTIVELGEEPAIGTPITLGRR